MKLIFFGTQSWSAELLESLTTDSFFQVVGVVTQPDKPSGRFQVSLSSPIKQMAKTLGLSLFQPLKLNDPAFLAQIKTLQAPLAVVIAFGRLIPKSLLTHFPFGFINVHPSLLPLLRGPSPVPAAILAGETKSGVSIIQIDTEMDHGPLLAQKEIPIAPEETTQSFMQKVVKESRPFLIDTLKAYANGWLSPIAQNHEKATYCQRLTKNDGYIDWNKPANIIHRAIRAYQPWPGTWTSAQINGKTWRLKILKARPLDNKTPHPCGFFFVSEGKLLISAQNSMLEILTLQPEGKKAMPAPAFVAGYGSLLGLKLDSTLMQVQEEK